MTIEALSLTLCLVSGIFGRPGWTPELCQERAGQIMTIATEHKLDPMLFVAVNIQECDMRETVDAPIYVGTGKHKKQIGFDRCPMGVRQKGAAALQEPKDPVKLYDLAAGRMERWKAWCERNHKGQHHFISHYNQGNPIYAAQVLAFLAVIKGKPIKDLPSLTTRTKEIVRRVVKALRSRQAQAPPEFDAITSSG
jgi:hypothetical protein